MGCNIQPTGNRFEPSKAHLTSLISSPMSSPVQPTYIYLMSREHETLVLSFMFVCCAASFHFHTSEIFCFLQIKHHKNKKNHRSQIIHVGVESFDRKSSFLSIFFSRRVLAWNLRYKKLIFRNGFSLS